MKTPKYPRVMVSGQRHNQLSAGSKEARHQHRRTRRAKVQSGQVVERPKVNK